MPSTSQPLELHRRFIWVDAQLTGEGGRECNLGLIFDSGTPHTILSTRIARLIGFPESKKVANSHYEDAAGNLLHGYAIRVPAFTVMGRTLHNYKVGCHDFFSKDGVVALLGLDFFLETNLLLAFLDRKMNMEWR